MALVLLCSCASTAILPTPDRHVVSVEARGCSAVAEKAVGWVARDDLIVTVAHVVGGSTDVYVDGVLARPVALDLRTDVAVLALEGPLGATPPPSALDLAEEQTASQAWLARFVGGSPEVVATSSGEVVVARVEELTGPAVVERQAIPVDFTVAPGDSGAPVVNRRGQLVGMVFAVSRQTEDRSWAVSAAEIASLISGVDSSSPPVATGSCQP